MLVVFLNPDQTGAAGYEFSIRVSSDLDEYILLCRCYPREIQIFATVMRQAAVEHRSRAEK
jgi:hypothetical protein